MPYNDSTTFEFRGGVTMGIFEFLTFGLVSAAGGSGGGQGDIYSLISFPGHIKPKFVENAFKSLESSAITSDICPIVSSLLAGPTGMGSADERSCGILNTWFLETANSDAKVLSVIWAINSIKLDLGSKLIELVSKNKNFPKHAKGLHGFLAGLDDCDKLTILYPKNWFTLTHSGYARVAYTSSDSYFTGTSNYGCASISPGGTLNSNLIQTTIESDISAGPIVNPVSSSNNYMLTLLEDVLSGADQRTDALQNAQQTAFRFADHLVSKYFSRSLLQSIGVGEPYLARISPLPGVIASRRALITIDEQPDGVTASGLINYDTGAITIGVSPYTFGDYIQGGPNSNPLYNYSSGLGTTCGELATWLTQNLLPTSNGAPARIHDEAAIMTQFRTTISGMFIGDGISQIASALCAGLSTKNPTALLSPVIGAEGFGQFIYGDIYRAARILNNIPTNDGLDNYAWRMHMYQSRAPLYTAQVILEETTPTNLQGFVYTGRDGVSPPGINANLYEQFSPMDFGASVFVSLFMKIANAFGEEKALKIFLRAINRMGQVTGTYYTACNLRCFSADILAAATSLYGIKVRDYVEFALLQRGFPTVDGLSVKARMDQRFPPAPGTTLRGQSGMFSSFASAQPGIVFADANVDQCNWYADGSMTLSTLGETPLYQTLQFSPFSEISVAGDRIDFRMAGSLGAGNNPSMNGALISSLKEQPLENMTVFVNTTTRTHFAYYRCLAAGIIDPISGFGLMNFEVRPPGFSISKAMINGFGLTMTKISETPTHISFRSDIVDYSSNENGGPYVRDYSASIEVSNLSAPILRTGSSFTVTAPKNEVMKIDVARTTGGLDRGTISYYQPTNDIDTTVLTAGKSPTGQLVTDPPSRASFVHGYPRGAWQANTSQMVSIIDDGVSEGSPVRGGAADGGGDSEQTPLLYGTADP